jgi:predicted Fe-Mo cluster-binding NifX family protein
MKVAVTAVEPRLDAQVDPRFGRCPCFLIVETDDLSFEAVGNANQGLGQGAGIQSARFMAERGVQCVLTGNCGPNAHQALSAAGISIVVGCAGTVRQVVEQFKAGQLKPAATANVPGHSGLGESSVDAPGPEMPATASPAAPSGIPMAPGSGPGIGMGRGGGMGRGMGRGRGQGGGGGRGGRGRGRCGGRNSGA